MIENNHLRIKIYVFIFLVALTCGGIELRGYYDFAQFGMAASIGFGFTLLYDIYVYFKDKNKKA